MNQRTRVIGIVAGLVVLVMFAWLFLGGGAGVQQEVSDKQPVDVVLDFYDAWLEALRSEEGDPYDAGLAEAAILSEALRAQLLAARGGGSGDADPVICSATAPEQLAARPVYTQEERAQVLVSGRGEGASGHAVVTLNRLRGGWYIDQIECSEGDVPPEREFSFEQTGFLLKSVPEPFDPSRWHLVFEENGEPGHVAPLFFDGASMCEAADGSVSVCDPARFIEPTEALVQGAMTELGVAVERVKFTK